MKIKYGNDKTQYGPGVSILLSGGEVSAALEAYLVAHGVYIIGPRTMLVNDDLCHSGNVYVDPSGVVITPKGRNISGRGPEGT